MIPRYRLVAMPQRPRKRIWKTLSFPPQVLVLINSHFGLRGGRETPVSSLALLAFKAFPRLRCETDHVALQQIEYLHPQGHAYVGDVRSAGSLAEC